MSIEWVQQAYAIQAEQQCPRTIKIMVIRERRFTAPVTMIDTH